MSDVFISHVKESAAMPDGRSAAPLGVLPVNLGPSQGVQSLRPLDAAAENSLWATNIERRLLTHTLLDTEPALTRPRH